MKAKIFFYTLLLFCFIKGFCQQKPYVYFDSIYDCANNKKGTAFTTYETSYGYIVAGGFTLVNKIICILKTDKLGNKIEVKIFDRAGCHLWVGAEGSLTKTTDGGYALGGGVTSSINSKALLVKFNANGDTLWTKEFGDNIVGSFHTARQCKQTKDKGYILIGEKEMGLHNEDVLLIKTDSLGNLQWQKNFGGPYHEMGWTIAVTPDSGYLIGGYTYIWETNYSHNALVIKTDSLGNVQWQKELGGPFDDCHAVVNVARDGNLFVQFTYAFSQPYPDVPLAKLNIIKLDIFGNIIWDKKVGPLRYISYMDGFYELTNGNILTAGYHMQAVGVGLATIFMLNSFGDSLWWRDYKRVLYNGTNTLFNIQQTTDNGFIACGEVASGTEPPYGKNMWLLKLDSMGCLVPNCDGVIIVEPENKDNENVMKVFPNPAQNKLNIMVRTSENKCSVLRIYNMQGLLVAQQKLTQQQSEMDISELPDGVYIARLGFENGSWAQERFVVIK
jgi:hypothetical protein